MKKLKLLFLLLILSIPTFAADIKSGGDLVAAMRKKYDGKWYKTLTFVQKTIDHKPDGTSESSIWYEAMSVPGKLRIDIAPLEKGDGILFADNKVYSFRDGKLAGSRPFSHPLMILGFDVYMQPAETTVDQLKAMNIDMSLIHQEVWQGKTAYVVGAKQGDLNTPQFWVDKDNLLFVRLIELKGKDKKSVQETQFNKYQKAKGGGWVSAEVQFFVDGKRTTSEEYSDIQTGMPLETDLWNPEKWTTADRTYFKKK
jgi:outer membrane lipoprotein-sorting protein